MSSSPEERWLPVVGYEDLYEASDQGRVRNARTGLVLKPRTHQGRLDVTLSRNGRVRTRLIHQMVLESFVEARPAGLVACHLNGDSRDNRLVNLRWDTVSANTLDSVRHGTHNEARKTRCSNGHEYSKENTWVCSRTGRRSCRTCTRERVAAIKSRKKAAP